MSHPVIDLVLFCFNHYVLLLYQKGKVIYMSSFIGPLARATYDLDIYQHLKKKNN